MLKSPRTQPLFEVGSNNSTESKAPIHLYSSYPPIATKYVLPFKYIWLHEWPLLAIFNGGPGWIWNVSGSTIHVLVEVETGDDFEVDMLPPIMKMVLGSVCTIQCPLMANGRSGPSIGGWLTKTNSVVFK